MVTAVQTSPYEILLRFNCEIGEIVGHLRGCHRVMATYLVDDAGAITGKVTTAEVAADFPPDELVKYLGEQFSAFNAGLEAVKVAKDKVDAELEKATAKIAELETQSAAKFAELESQLKEKGEEIKAAREEIATLTEFAAV